MRWLLLIMSSVAFAQAINWAGDSVWGHAVYMAAVGIVALAGSEWARCRPGPRLASGANNDRRRRP